MVERINSACPPRIEEKLYTSECHIMTDKYSISFLVPAQSVGLLVGKHGSLFRSIILLTTANINFQRADDIPNQNYQRILCIRGSNTSSVLQALSMVLEKLHQPRSKLGTAEPGFEDDTSISVRY